MRPSRRNDQTISSTKALTCLRSLLLFGTAMLAAALFILLGPSVSEARAQAFVDVNQTDWFYSPVEALATQGVIGGYPDGSFRPYAPVTRAQFASMMAALLDLTPVYNAAFIDVLPGDWFAGAVGALYEAGLVQGSANGVFAPEAELSRQQAATLVMRAYAAGRGVKTEPGAEASTEAGPQAGAELLTGEGEVAMWLQGFKDRAAIAPVHRAAVADAYRLGVVSGFEDSRFYPFLNLTRAQAAGVLWAALGATPSARLEPAPLAPAETAYPTTREGDRGPLVGWMEGRLAALSYDPGAVDGVFDSRTAEAVMAFQKVEGLDRTGVASAGIWSRLVTGDRPAARKMAGGDRVEIDLSRQVLFVVADGIVERTVPIASGRSGWRTPTGTFAVERKLPYWRQSYLGMLYKPAYFRGGYAIHGSYSVPPYPASHGCVRVSVVTMDVLYPLLPVGMRVDVYY
ncbi:MAG: S-layer homology domain-containing protein [bacterium]